MNVIPYFFLLLLNGMLSSIFLKGSMIAEADAYQRAIFSWLHFSPLFSTWIHMTDGIWLPGHPVILHMGSLLTGLDPLIAPRLVSFAIGSIGIIIFYRLSLRILSGNWAMAAAVLYTIFPLRLILSTQTISEAVFLPVMLLVMDRLAQKENIRWNMLLSALALSIGMTIRYEAWFFVPIWLWCMAHSKIPKIFRYASIFCIAFTEFGWVAYQSWQGGSLFGFVYQRIANTQAIKLPQYYNMFLTTKQTIESLIVSMPFPMLAAVLYGLYRYGSRTRLFRERVLFVITPVFFLSLTIGLVYFGLMEWTPLRYYLLPLALAIPSAMYGLQQLYDKNRRAFLVFIIVMLLLVPGYTRAIVHGLTYGAWYGVQSPKKVQSFFSLVQYLHMHNHDYTVVIPYSADVSFAAAAAYLLQRPSLLSENIIGSDDYTMHPTDYPKLLILEKEQESAPTGGVNVLYENDFFSVERNPEGYP